ncbi:MAG: hypothetical protein ABIP94_14085 [Planctomycetota bacterium]
MSRIESLCLLFTAGCVSTFTLPPLPLDHPANPQGLEAPLPALPDRLQLREPLLPLASPTRTPNQAQLDDSSSFTERRARPDPVELTTDGSCSCGVCSLGLVEPRGPGTPLENSIRLRFRWPTGIATRPMAKQTSSSMGSR